MNGVFWLGVSLILGTFILLMCDLWILRRATKSYTRANELVRMDIDILVESGVMDKEAAITYLAKIAEIDKKPTINNEVCSAGCPGCDGIYKGGKTQ